MEFIIKHFAFFWSVKRAIIKAALAGMSEAAKKKMLGEVLASEMADYRIGKRPYKVHPEKRENRKKRQPQQTEIAA
jgi:hypothetical protein